MDLEIWLRRAVCSTAAKSLDPTAQCNGTGTQSQHAEPHIGGAETPAPNPGMQEVEEGGARPLGLNPGVWDGALSGHQDPILMYRVREGAVPGLWVQSQHAGQGGGSARPKG